MTAPAPVQITVNGTRREVAAAYTVAELVDALGLSGKRIAVERNGEIVPRSLHGRTGLADGDQLEIVVAVGGG
ncbi:MAG: sulfur carrier protein ThiS [Burkholderiaceae bacterium]